MKIDRDDRAIDTRFHVHRVVRRSGAESAKVHRQIASPRGDSGYRNGTVGGALGLKPVRGCLSLLPRLVVAITAVAGGTQDEQPDQPSAAASPRGRRQQ